MCLEKALRDSGTGAERDIERKKPEKKRKWWFTKGIERTRSGIGDRRSVEERGNERGGSLAGF